MQNFLDLTPMNDGICNYSELGMFSIHLYLGDIWFSDSLSEHIAIFELILN